MWKILLRLFGPLINAWAWTRYHLQQRDESVKVLLMCIKRRDAGLALRARNTLFADRYLRDVSHEIWQLLTELDKAEK